MYYMIPAGSKLGLELITAKDEEDLVNVFFTDKRIHPKL